MRTRKCMKHNEGTRKKMHAGSGAHEKTRLHMRKSTRQSECTRERKHTEE